MLRRIIVYIRFCLVSNLLRLQLFQAYIVSDDISILTSPVKTTYTISVECEGALHIIQAQSLTIRYMYRNDCHRISLNMIFIDIMSFDSLIRWF